jgi:hypothetical protein
MGPPKEVRVYALLGWFDLTSGSGMIGPAGEATMPVWQQALLYMVVIGGVLLSEAVAMARAGQPISLKLSWPWVVTASAIALVVFPAVWREIGVMPDATMLVQMGLAAQGGVFWGVLVAGAEKQAQA